MAADLGKDGIRVNAISAGPIRTLAASELKLQKCWQLLNIPHRYAVLGDNRGCR